ncbi:hypothetical protein [Stutzerimonas urumqiensis]|uniref:hypothetical protein n=1 Tax=Stutzerimonas urumqiensis TaxID=638269 RepID=UPI001FE54454|nr:hypothetical protein [Stutzerimonas urumqiensis]
MEPDNAASSCPDDHRPARTPARQRQANMNRSPIRPFLIATVATFAVWALSPWLTGHVEPWDADGWYYAVALVLSGVLSGLLAPKPLWALYLGGMAGQVLYLLLLRPIDPLLGVGLLFVSLWSLVFVTGGFIGGRLRRWSR